MRAKSKRNGEHDLRIRAVTIEAETDAEMQYLGHFYNDMRKRGYAALVIPGRIRKNEEGPETEVEAEEGDAKQNPLG